MASAAALADQRYEPFGRPTQGEDVRGRYVAAKRLRQPRVAEVHRFDTGLVPGLTIETSAPPVRGLAEALLRLHELKLLATDWDGYGAAPVHPAVFGPALDLIAFSLMRCHQPEIIPVNTGGLSLSWACGDRELDIEVAPAGTCSIFLSDEGADQEVDTGAGRPLIEAKAMIGQFCSSN